MNINIKQFIYQLLIILFIVNSGSAFVLNKIIAKVNDTIITDYDLEKEILKYIKSSNVSIDDQMKKNILDGMVRDIIMQDLYPNVNYSLGQQEIKRLVQNKILEVSANFPTEAEFEKYLADEGYTVSTYIQKLHDEINNNPEFQKNLIREKVINSEAINYVVIGDKEIFKKYDYQIILVGKEKTAADIYQLLNSGQKKFSELAKQYSKGPNPEQGGVQSDKIIGDNLLVIEKSLLDLAPHQTSGYFPVTSDDSGKFLGYALIKLINEKSFDINYLKNRLSKEKFSKNYAKLTEKEKSEINKDTNERKQIINNRLFTIKIMNAKNRVLENIWKNSYINY